MGGVLSPCSLLLLGVLSSQVYVDAESVLPRPKLLVIAGDFASQDSGILDLHPFAGKP